jgi:hypothetical protein
MKIVFIKLVHKLRTLKIRSQLGFKTKQNLDVVVTGELNNSCETCCSVPGILYCPCCNNCGSCSSCRPIPLPVVTLVLRISVGLDISMHDIVLSALRPTH